MYTDDRQTETYGAIPCWIWHPENVKRLRVTVSKSFVLSRALSQASLFVAATGDIAVELDGQPFGLLPEHPALVAGYTRIAGFPVELDAGIHEIRITVACSTPMPISPVSIHLSDRLVGVNAYLCAAGYFLGTDAGWSADGEHAAEICRYGEEPYGDLEQAPDWFIAGGYGDIAVSPVASVQVKEASHLRATLSGQRLSLTGIHRQAVEWPAPERKERHIFYHLRKQEEWRLLQDVQRGMDLSAAPRVLIDLGQEHNVRLRVLNHSPSAVTVLWNGAESLYELDHYSGCITESFVVTPSGSFTTLPQGMRFVRLHLFGAPGQAFDLTLECEAACVQLEQTGSFTCDLALVNDIHAVSVHTNRVCHQLGLWDGIKRDRLNWTYDLYMAGKADYVLWSDWSVLRRSLRELGSGTPYGYWMNSIDTYTLWWINNLWEYYLFSGDREFIEENQADLQRHVHWIAANLDTDTGYFKERHAAFIEWAPMSADESWFALHALLALTKSNLQKLCAHFPHFGIDADWQIPPIAEASFSEADALATGLLGIASGYLQEEAARIFLQRQSVADPITPLSAYWYAECCSQLDLHEQAWQTISTVWGWMINQGASTFWEGVTLSPQSDYHDGLTTYTAYDSYRMSLCHSWSSTPVQWLSRFVLGVEPLEPGYQKVRFQPHSVGGMTQCQGTVPTRYGSIHVHWHLDSNGEMQAVIEAPAGIEVVDNVSTVCK